MNLMKLIVRDIKKHFVQIVFFSIQITFILIFIIILSSNIISNLNASHIYNTIKSTEITAFKPYYPESFSKDMNNNHRLDDFEKFYARSDILSFIDFTTNQKNKSLPAVIGIGNFNKLYNLPALNSKEVEIWIGAGVKDFNVGDVMEIQNFGILKGKVVGRLEKNNGYYKGTYLNSLDHAILINMSHEALWTQLVENNKQSSKVVYLLQTIFANTFVVNDTSSLAYDFSQSVTNSGIMQLNPYSFNHVYENLNLNQVQNTEFFTIIGISAILFSIIGMIISVLNLVDSNITEYCIHILYGGDKEKILQRIAGYLLCILIPANCVVILFFVTVSLYDYFILILIEILMLSILLLTLIIANSKLDQVKLLELLRRDV